ncbi:MAG: MBL fold metallo-hydrolase [Deltaproteobacteria bacterium]|nr:MBL fold metallo-hydrolase [Deltaproteobacteria bacterium]
MAIRLGFLGGASGIGASCVLVEIDGFRAVIDAGIRQARGETLPDFETLRVALEGRPPDVVMLTHAHIDHSGALPVLHRAFPKAPIVMTRGTRELLRILLLDAVKLMGLEREEDFPLYSLEEVEATLASVRAVGFDDPVDVANGRVWLIPAGHILGAGCAVVESGGRSVLVSGDISITDQRTVPGMPVPRFSPDVMVVESTYGHRLHASRAAEERRLAEQVSSAIQSGGHVLIPAFAVGRAQEVLLILQDAMQRGTIPEFPVLADGMVRAACDAYGRHGELLLRSLRRRMDKAAGSAFFPSALPFSKVRGREDRERAISGPPCCVVASSGMLAGGASPIYARAFAVEPASLIAVTGHIDEEAPGRALLDLADRTRRELRVMGEVVEVRARVERYGLSAHADADEIVGLLERAKPRLVCLVHGERQAREALQDRIESVLESSVRLPEDGEVFEVDLRPSARGRAKWRGPGIGQGQPLVGPDSLAQIRELLFEPGRGAQRTRTVEEIATVWFGESPSSQEVDDIRKLLETDRVHFSPDPRLPFRYLASPSANAMATPRSTPLSVVQDELDRALSPDSGVYRRSAHQEERRVVLAFELPDVQAPKLQPIFESIASRTGWSIEVSPKPHQGKLAELSRKLAPTGSAVTRDPSLRFDEKRVVVEIDPFVEGTEELERVHLERTGWRLSFAPGSKSAGAIAKPLTQSAMDPQEAKRLVNEVFAGVDPDLGPQKCTFPDGAIVLHFTHPGMASRYKLEDLATRAGREVRIHPHPVHQKLVELVRARLPDSWAITKAPAYVPRDDRVRVTVWSAPNDSELQEVKTRIQSQLGVAITLVVEDE